MKPIVVAAILSFVAVVVGRRVAPDAITGSAVRQLTPSQLRKIALNSPKEITPFSDGFADVKSINGFKSFFTFDAECEGSEMRIACPGQTTSEHSPPSLKCISEHQLCDEHADCPNGEDEDTTLCTFHGHKRVYYRLINAELRKMFNVHAKISSLKKTLKTGKTRKTGSKTSRQRHRNAKIIRYFKLKAEREAREANRDDD